jgi:N-acetylglutamate synthase-like GNAT family acetyltransferase
MLVRKARPNDAAAITQLYRELVPGDQHIKVDPKRLDELADHPTNHLFVAEADQICGTAFLTICLDPMYGFAPYGLVENIIVTASARGTGAGRALMVAVEDATRAARCTKLCLLSTVTRVEAHAFFQHLGYDGERKRGFIKYLNRTPPLRLRTD